MLAGGEAANVSRHHHAPMPMGPGNECRDDSGVCAISERSPFSTGSKKPRPSARVPDDYSRSEEHTSELQSLMRISYAVFCLKKKKKKTINNPTNGLIVEPITLQHNTNIRNNRD